MFCKIAIKRDLSAMLRILAIVMLAMVLVSCSGNKEKRPASNEIKIHLVADKDINPNENGDPAPLTLFIYNVHDAGLFSRVNIYEVIDGSSKALQSASSKIYEVTLQPGSSKTILLKTEDDMRTLGIIGAYRNFNDSICLVTWDLPKKDKSWWGALFENDAIAWDVNFKKTAMTIKKMD